MPTYVDTCNNASGNEYRILIIGNSISMHPISNTVGWYHFSGMAATSIKRDYVHLLFKKIEQKMPNRRLKLRLSNLANFERDFINFDISVTDSLKSFKPDLIVFQLGENVDIENNFNEQLFVKKYSEIINTLKKHGTKTILTTSFFPSSKKNKIIECIALATNSYLVDLSHLPLLDETNYAKYELDYKGDKSVWKVDGVGIHPGDKGMENIAQQIFIPINVIIEDENHQ